MARQNEEIDDNSASGGAQTVMVGGMDDLIPGGKAKAEDDLEIEIEAPKPPPGRGPSTKEPDDDEHDEDARLAYDVQDDDEIEERGLSRRQRRNKARKTVVTSRDQEIAQLYQRVDALTGMIGQMGQSHVGLTINNIDTQIGAANQALTLADVEIKKAVAAGDLARYDELRALKDEAQARVWQLARQRQGITQELQQRSAGGTVRPQNGAAPAQPQNQLDQRTQDFTETFMDRFDFDPNGTDERTLIIKALDDSVAAEGYLSNRQQYWLTLEKKLARQGIYPVGSEGGDRDDSPSREAPKRLNGGGRPPTASGFSRRGTGTTFRLDPMARDYLESEGLLHPQGLNDAQKARRAKLLNDWQTGMQRMRRGEV